MLKVEELYCVNLETFSKVFAIYNICFAIYGAYLSASLLIGLDIGENELLKTGNSES